MQLNRRRALALTVSAIAVPAIIESAAAAEEGAAVQTAVDRFSTLPFTSRLPG